MDVTALCIRLLLEVLVLQIAQVHHGYFAQKAAFPRIVPDRLQFFHYEKVSVHCDEIDGFTRWRLTTNLNKIPSANSSGCHLSAPSCTIYPILQSHSGEYWCEDEEGGKSHAVNISVTAGSVIMESPAHPVLEGEDVILYCKNKRTQSKHIADFYKDGSRLSTRYTGNLIIQNVSMSDEGLYKCSISGAGESPESRLKISKQSKHAPDEKTTTSPRSDSPHLLTLLCIVVGALLTALLFGVGLFLCRKHKVFVSFSCEKPTSGSHTVPEESVVDPHHATYAVVVKQRKEKGHDNVADPENMTYSVIKMEQKEPKVCRANTDPHLQEESFVYSLIDYRNMTPD